MRFAPAVVHQSRQEVLSSSHGGVLELLVPLILAKAHRVVVLVVVFGSSQRYEARVRAEREIDAVNGRRRGGSSAA